MQVFGIGNSGPSDGGSGLTFVDLFTQYLGDGSDGDLVIANGQTVTLTQDKTYRTLTVQSGGILETGFRRVYATESIDIQSGGVVRVTVPVVASGPFAAGNGSLGAGNSLGSLNGGGAGGATTTGSNGTNGNSAYGGVGGSGGAVGATAGGSGGTIANEDTYLITTSSGGTLWPSPIRVIPWKRLDYALGFFGRPGVPWQAGSGGGGGASVDASHRGGAGGMGGATVFLCAPLITINGVVRARGGAGAASNSSSNGGGGGGGGGGLIVTNTLIAIIGTPTYDVSGGIGGAGAGTGAAGANGAAGLVINNVWS